MKRLYIPINGVDYNRVRRACVPCAAHVAARDSSCPARYAVAIAARGADTYHKHAAVRHLSAAMEAAAKKVRAGGADGGRGSTQEAGIVGALEALQRVRGGPGALFGALTPMLSTEVNGSLWVGGYWGGGTRRGVILFSGGKKDAVCSCFRLVRKPVFMTPRHNHFLNYLILPHAIARARPDNVCAFSIPRS